MPTFEEMLNSFKSKGNEFASKSTFQWFLNEIRETVKELSGGTRIEKSSRITETQSQHERGEDTEAGNCGQ